MGSYVKPLNPLIPRPALILLGAITSGVYLLEHAIWSHNIGESTSLVDIEVFRRWIFEGGMESAIEAVQRIRLNPAKRVDLNSELVFGEKASSKL